MHLADGTLSPPIIAATAAGAGLAVTWGAWRLVDEDLIRCGLLGCAGLNRQPHPYPHGGHLGSPPWLGDHWWSSVNVSFLRLRQALCSRPYFGLRGESHLGASILAMGIPAWLAGLAIRRIPWATGLVAGISAFVAIQMGWVRRLVADFKWRPWCWLDLPGCASTSCLD